LILGYSGKRFYCRSHVISRDIFGRQWT